MRFETILAIELFAAAGFMALVLLAKKAVKNPETKYLKRLQEPKTIVLRYDILEGFMKGEWEEVG